MVIFVAVAEQQSFAEAARQLNRSPASVTRGVAAVEERLQTRLFNRTTRSVALTDAGARYLENCRRLLAVYDELEAVNLAERVEPRGWINVTAPVMFGRLHVLPLVRSFLDRYPQVDIRLLLLDRVVSLVDEGLDLGVRIGQLPDSSLRAVLVGQVRRVICAAPQYIASYGVPATPRALGNHRGGMHSRDTHSRPLVVSRSERGRFRSRYAPAGGKHHGRSGGRRTRRFRACLHPVLSGGAAYGGRLTADYSRRIRTPARTHSHRASGRPAPLGQGPPISRLRRRSAPHQIRARIKRTPGSLAYTRRTP
jgi:DNA-binding transcriptional LysR family regulator